MKFDFFSFIGKALYFLRDVGYNVLVNIAATITTHLITTLYHEREFVIQRFLQYTGAIRPAFVKVTNPSYIAIQKQREIRLSTESHVLISINYTIDGFMVRYAQVTAVLTLMFICFTGLLAFFFNH